MVVMKPKLTSLLFFFFFFFFDWSIDGFMLFPGALERSKKQLTSSGISIWVADPISSYDNRYT